MEWPSKHDPVCLEAITYVLFVVMLRDIYRPFQVVLMESC